MANVKATMTDIRVIIREFSRGTSRREMEWNLKLSRTSLRNYRDRAEASGRSMVDLLSLNDAELQAIMLKGRWHRLEALETGTMIVEFKNGPCEPIGAGDILSLWFQYL